MNEKGQLIVYLDDDHTEMGAIYEDVLIESNGDVGDIVTEIADEVAEGYGAEFSVVIVKGKDGKFYVIHAYAGRGCRHDNRVIGMLDYFKSTTERTPMVKS